MAQRVLIQAGVNSAMRVSLPGFDVNTADCDQTCFDSRWSGLTPYATGQLTSSNNIPATFSFGETLDVEPIFIGHAVNLIGGSPTTVFENSMRMIRGNGTNNWWYVLVTTSSLVFTVQAGNTISRLTFTLFKRPAG